MSKPIFAALVLAAAAFVTAPQAFAGPKDNAKLVKTAMTELFVKRDPAAIGRYWAKTYIQHNPMVPNGVDALPEMIKGFPANFSYEPGMVIAQGDYVAIHGRYTGFGPTPMVAVDIFRVENGKLAEHWDVLQPEVPASASRNGNPMFVPGQ